MYIWELVEGVNVDTIMVEHEHIDAKFLANEISNILSTLLPNIEKYILSKTNDALTVSIFIKDFQRIDKTILNIPCDIHFTSDRGTKLSGDRTLKFAYTPGNIDNSLKYNFDINVPYYPNIFVFYKYNFREIYDNIQQLIKDTILTKNSGIKHELFHYFQDLDRYDKIEQIKCKDVSDIDQYYIAPKEFEAWLVQTYDFIEDNILSNLPKESIVYELSNLDDALGSFISFYFLKPSITIYNKYKNISNDYISICQFFNKLDTEKLDLIKDQLKLRFKGIWKQLPLHEAIKKIQTTYNKYKFNITSLI